MKRTNAKPAVTLIEMIIVVAIIALLAGVVVSVATRIDNQAKENLTRSTITLIGNALEQFEDFGWTYTHPYYADLDFPPDCNDYFEVDFLDTLCGAMGFADASGNPTATRQIMGIDTSVIPLVERMPVAFDPANAGCEGMCFFLNQVPQCREILDQIDESLLTAEGTAAGIKVNKVLRLTTLSGAVRDYQLLRIVDPWGTTLRYDYYPYMDPTAAYTAVDIALRNRMLRTFPLVTSAGPDKTFGTGDDISNAGARR